jgi:uncharacterized protein (DUF885 family)
VREQGARSIRCSESDARLTQICDEPPAARVESSGACTEGWGLYFERLAKEQGRFADPMQDFGRLQDEMLRACRLVVDSGSHAKKWTRQQMID